MSKRGAKLAPPLSTRHPHPVPPLAAAEPRPPPLFATLVFSLAAWAAPGGGAFPERAKLTVWPCGVALAQDGVALRVTSFGWVSVCRRAV